MPNNNSLNSAIDLGVLDGAIAPRSGFVGTDDRDDFYRFTLTENSDLQFSLTGLGEDPAQLALIADLNGDGIVDRREVIEEDDVLNSSSSTRDRSISTSLSPGTYWVRVNTARDSQNTAYTLSAQAQARRSDSVSTSASTLRTARNMGVLGQQPVFRDVVDATNRNDFYRFTLNQNSDLSFALTGLGNEPAQLALIADLNGDGIVDRSEVIEEDDVLNSSSSTRDRSINTSLSPGTYWVRVNTARDSQNTAYQLAASATARTGDNASDPGESLTDALDIGNLSNSLQVFNDVVDPTDRNDLYRFNLTQDGNVSFALTGLGNEPAQLALIADLNGDGIIDRREVIEKDDVLNSSSSTRDRSITRALSAGTYWVRVNTARDSQNTAYTLTAQSDIEAPTIQPENPSRNDSSERSNFLGGEVELQVFSPTLQTPISRPVRERVRDGIEFVSDNYNFSSNVVEHSFDLTANSIFYQVSDSESRGRFTIGTFNGYLLSDVSNSLPAIRGVRLNTAGTTLGLDSSDITFTADQIRINVEGLRFRSGDTFRLDVDFSSEVILGSAGADSPLFGTVADDEIRTLAGDDDIFPGAGNDIIVGGLGGDYVKLESGNDILRYESVAESTLAVGGAGVDYISGFVQGQDRIDVSALGYTNILGLTVNKYDRGNGSLNTEVRDDSTGFYVGFEGNYNFTSTDFIFAS